MEANRNAAQPAPRPDVTPSDSMGGASGRTARNVPWPLAVTLSLAALLGAWGVFRWVSDTLQDIETRIGDLDQRMTSLEITITNEMGETRSRFELLEGLVAAATRPAAGTPEHSAATRSTDR